MCSSHMMERERMLTDASAMWLHATDTRVFLITVTLNKVGGVIATAAVVRVSTGCYIP